MGLELEYLDGHTPLDLNEKDGLLISSITTRAELDEFEQQNIEEAIQWTLSKSFKQEVIFTEQFLKQVHKKMYANVWMWAGEFRKTNKNLGVDKWQISVDLKNLLDNTLYWIKHEIYEPDELAIRFKHRLVSIHCFPNGNGRHSRLMADIIIEKIFKQPVFTWGQGSKTQDQLGREKYLLGIKSADKGEFKTLIDFARS